ncbi:MAG: clostripain-related cysteine peptidase [Candidatus Thermoplasmatota archaeon]|nr:clostripain-related cysteine peptidase [Candidatus Thermoplasmatota archaeon]
MSINWKKPHLSSHGWTGSLEGKRTVALVLVSIMSVFLISSIGIMLIFYDGSGTNNDPEEQISKGDLVIYLDDLPESLRSGMTEEVTGSVKDKGGEPVGDVSVSINFSSPDNNIYRAKTQPDGKFTLTFRSPVSESEGNQTLSLLTYKDDYKSDERTYNLPMTIPETWTFMIYMSDCDLEAWSISDINEMETIPNSPYLDIIVQLDRWESISPKDDISNDNWTTAKRFEIQNDYDPIRIASTELEDLGEIDSADPEELSEFISYTMDNYISDNYALILWDHGSGIDGVCYEQSTEDDQVISIEELGLALDDSTDGGNRPLDLIGFDACLMSTIEVAYEIAPYADRMLSSEITEPNFGWDYTALEELTYDPFLDVLSICSLLMDSYILQSDTKSSRRSMSLCLTDLKKIDTVVEDLDALSNTINSAGPAEIYNMRLARKYAQPISDGTSSEAVDLQDLVEKIKAMSSNSMVMDDCDELIISIEEAVIEFNTVQGFSDLDVDGLNGLSIFSPDFKDVFSSKEDYDDLKFTKDTSWSDTLMAMYENMELEMKEKVLSIDVDQLSCRTRDRDGNHLPDTMECEFSIVSTSAVPEDAFLGINVYNLRGMYIDSTWMNITIESNSTKGINIIFYPDGDDAESGLYRIAAYLCLGNTFDPLSLQDYTRTGYRWLEVFDDGT